MVQRVKASSFTVHDIVVLALVREGIADHVTTGAVISSVKLIYYHKC